MGIGVGHAWLADGESGLEPGRGPTDLAVGAKWRFFGDDDRGLGLAFTPSLTTPTGAETTTDRLGPGQGFWSLDARVAAVQDWSERWSTNVDIGYETPFGDRGDARGALGANAAVGWRLLPWFQPGLELNYAHDFIRDGPDAYLLSVTAEVGMPIAGRLCIRAGAQRGIAGRNADRTEAFLVSVDVHF